MQGGRPLGWIQTVYNRIEPGQVGYAPHLPGGIIATSGLQKET